MPTSAGAYLEYLTDQAWHNAAQSAGEWLDSRPTSPAAPRRATLLTYFASLSIFANSRIVSVNLFGSMTSRRRARNLEIY